MHLVHNRKGVTTMKMTWIDWIVMILIVVGGLNWGLVGFFQYDLVATIFGDESTMARIVYDLVGLAALYQIVRVVMMGGAKKTATPTQPTM